MFWLILKLTNYILCGVNMYTIVARYPDYFRKREERKQEYIKMWENKYGPSSPEESHWIKYSLLYLYLYCFVNV